jgi:DNA-binding transcriptional LysR family regulator
MQKCSPVERRAQGQKRAVAIPAAPRLNRPGSRARRGDPSSLRARTESRRRTRGRRRPTKGVIDTPPEAEHSRVDLRQVHYFVTVARELHFSRAADLLHISAPALSQQVKALERHLAVQLLVRDSRNVSLTAAGEVFADHGRRLLREADSAVQAAQSAGGVITGHLSIAALHEAESAFEPLLTGFHAARPTIGVKVRNADHAELIAAVRERTADAALTWAFLLDRGDDTAGLQTIAVAPTEVLAALHPEHPLAADSVVPRGERLRSTPAVLFERDYSPASFDYAVEQLYGQDVVNPPVTEISVTVRAQEAMARRLTTTPALAPLSRPIADLLRSTLTIRPFDPPWIMTGRVICRQDNSSAPLAAFVAAAGESYQERRGAGPDVQTRRSDCVVPAAS